MRRYLRILYASFRASLIADLEYRMNIVMRVVTDVMWYAAQLSVFEVLFRHTSVISGWTIEDTRVFMCMMYVVDAFWMFLFHENLEHFSDKVSKGEIDLILAKPVSSQFMLSFQRFNTAYLANIVITHAMLFYALSQLPQGINWLRLFLLFITVPCALAITYGIRFFFTASALIYTRAENISYLWFQFYRLGMRPDSIYPPWLRYIVLSIVPVGFIASVPSRLILHAPDLTLLTASLGLAAASVFFSMRYWRFALKFYSSSSS